MISAYWCLLQPYSNIENLQFTLNPIVYKYQINVDPWSTWKMNYFMDCHEYKQFRKDLDSKSRIVI